VSLTAKRCLTLARRIEEKRIIEKNCKEDVKDLPRASWRALDVLKGSVQ
jgi:hypothetical protein